MGYPTPRVGNSSEKPATNPIKWARAHFSLFCDCNGRKYLFSAIIALVESHPVELFHVQLDHGLHESYSLSLEGGGIFMSITRKMWTDCSALLAPSDPTRKVGGVSRRPTIERRGTGPPRHSASGAGGRQDLWDWWQLPGSPHGKENEERGHSHPLRKATGPDMSLQASTAFVSAETQAAPCLRIQQPHVWGSMFEDVQEVPSPQVL